MKKEISLVALGDIHAGSRAAVCIPDQQLAGGGSFRYSAAQRALYEAWCGLAKEWSEPDLLVCNGDAIEGQARKESGVPCWSTDLDDQIECAASLLKLYKARKYYMVDGTGYHVDAGGKSLEHHIGERIRAEKIGIAGARSDDELFLKIDGVTFHFAHHISIGTGWYKTTPLARELVFALLNESDKHRVDIVCRSHVHYFCGVEFTRQRGYILPCWQTQTRYMRKKSSFGMVPVLGALRFRIYPETGEVKLDKRFFKPVECKPKLFVYEQTDKG